MISVPSDYVNNEGLLLKAYLKGQNDSVEVELYDDGFSDDSLRTDLVPCNNIWSGGLNSSDIQTEGEYQLLCRLFLDSTKVLSEAEFPGIIVLENTPPGIVSVNGIDSGDSLVSGFEDRTVTVSIDDPNNDQSGHNDNQTLYLEFSTRDSYKQYVFPREDPLSDVIFTMDSTYAAGLMTNDRFTVRLIAEDLYGLRDSLEFSNVYIENSAPSLRNLIYPDTVFIPVQDSIFFSITVDVNDSQGCMEYQDVENVTLELNSYEFSMRDDGNENSVPYNSGDIVKNDGTYTSTFKVMSTNNEFEYPFTITAYDKAGNVSGPVNGTLIFIKDSVKSTKQEKNDTFFNYTDPFNRP